MAGVALDIERYFLAVFDSKGTDMRDILGRVGTDIDAGRIGQLDGVRNEAVHLRVVNRNQPVIVFVFNPVFQNVFCLATHNASIAFFSSKNRKSINRVLERRQHIFENSLDSDEVY